MDVEPKVIGNTALWFLNGPLAEQTILLQNPENTIGRDKQNDVCVLDPTVSRRHALIRYQNGQWTIENLSPSSYIAIDHQRVQQSVLPDNAVVQIGKNISFKLFLLDRKSLSPPRMLKKGKILSSKTSLMAVPLCRFSPGALVDGSNFTKVTPNGTLFAPMPGWGWPSLTISSNVSRCQQLYYLKKSVINIGCDADNDIVITDPTISDRHAQIVRDGEDIILIHPHPSREKTLNGLMYRGQHIRGDQSFRQPLAHGDVFRVGSDYGTLITFSFDNSAGRSVGVVPEIVPIPLLARRLTIGHKPDNSVVLDHLQVSAYHAVLEKVESGYRISDNNSTNHVYVNGQAVTNQILRTGDEIRIGPYRLIYTGSELRPHDESTHIRIEARNLKKVGNNAVVLLNDLSLAIPPRKFVALVGGSGTGKSTLMDALNGLRPAQEGTVTYNGVDYYHNLAMFNTQLGYVPQDDIVHRELTVAHALYYAARLRLPSDLTDEQILWRISEVLEDVEMTDRCDLMVSKLSGGQRKRVSIALELLANPSVFFLDEPTSGLDPGLDRKMMALLRRLADQGRTIILVTHATNNINACDYVCFLAQGGRLAYFGPPNKAKEFFEQSDFAEIYSALEPTKEQPDIPAQAEARFRASSDYQQYVVGPLSEGQDCPVRSLTSSLRQKSLQQARHESRGCGWSQFLLLSRRYLELLKNDRVNLLILLLQAPVIAIMLVLMVRFEVGVDIFTASKLVQCRTQLNTSSGPLILPQAAQTSQVDCSQVLTFLRTDSTGHGQNFVKHEGGVEQALQHFIMPGFGTNAQRVLFTIAFATILFGCINGSREIVKEAAIYRRERAVNLGILPYMFSKIVVLGFLCLFQSAILTLVVELGLPLYQGIFLSPVLETYITLTLTSFAGLMIGLAISAVAPTSDRAISFVPIVLLPQLYFSGTIVPLKGWFLQIVAMLFPARWAMVALGSSIGLHADTMGGDRLFGDDYTYHGTLFSIYSYSDALTRLLVSWLALVVITLVLMVIVGYCLKRKDVRV